MEATLPDRWHLSLGLHKEDEPADRSAYIDIVHSAQHPIAIDPPRLLDIDEDIDDGNPSTGHLRLFGENLGFYLKQ